MREEREASVSGGQGTTSAGVYAIFLLSGAAALVYQVIWARWLGLIFGNTTLSVSIILGAFMLGLALGSWVAGRVVRRLASPMWCYAVLELGIGFFALAFPLATTALDHLYTAVASADSPATATIAWRAALAFLLLLAPTSMMGATLPLLTEHFRRDPRHGRVWRAGVLYAVNTVGAAVGVIAASFLGIELLGVRNTTIAAAALNFLVAILGFALARGASAPRRRSGAPRAASLTASTALLALGLSGGLALASEVLWTRTLQIVVGNSTYAFATILVVYLVGVALGSAAFSGVVKRSQRLEIWMVWLLLGIGTWMLLATEAFGLLQGLAAGRGKNEVTAGDLLLLYVQAATLLLPLAILSGCMFPVGTRLLEPEADDAGGEQVARAYAWNTIGAVAGSLLAGFVVAVHFDFFQALALLAGGYSLAAAGIAALFLASGTLRAGPAVAWVLLALGMSSLGISQARRESLFVRGIERGNPGLEVVFHEPGLQGVTTVVRRRGEPYASSLLVNAQGMTTKLTDVKMMAHLPMLVHPDPRRVVVVCFGMGTTSRSALSHGAEVTSVELVPEVFEAFPHFFADAEQVRSDPRSRWIATDGRSFLHLTRERFDVITIDPPPPIDAAGVTNLYSREFVALARQRLAPGGIFAHWIPVPGTRSGVDTPEVLRMLLRTIVEEFPYTLVAHGLNGVGIHVLASDEPIEVDPQKIAARIGVAAVATDLQEWQEVPLAFFSTLVPPEALNVVLMPGNIHIFGRELQDVPILTDDRPRLEFDLWEMARSGRSKLRPGSWGR